MFAEEIELLKRRPGKYLSLGIAADADLRGKPVRVPWEVSAHAYNMKPPDVYLTPAELHDAGLMAQFQAYHVLGCYVFTPLEDYGFIAGFPELRDVYIGAGRNVKDLLFLRGLNGLGMLYLEGAKPVDLEPIYQCSTAAGAFPFLCLCFADCEVGDVSALTRVHNISELIVFGRDDDGERARWGRIPALTHRYYVSRK